jgi:hypothetical protein
MSIVDVYASIDEMVELLLGSRTATDQRPTN